jgi:PPOX class probable F420-dependent enzyme
MLAGSRQPQVGGAGHDRREKAMSNTESAIEAIARAKCISLTTFKRDGTPVATPIWFNIIDGKVLLATPASSWKVKRIRHNPRVEFAACTQRGRVTGPVFTGVARIISADELAPVLKAKRRRYLSARFIQLLPSARDQVGIEVVPGGPATPDAS